MYHFQHGNPGLMPQQGQPRAPPGIANNHPRRSLAINELLNEAPPRQFPLDGSYLLQPRYPYMPQPPAPIQTPYTQPQDVYRHPYLPEIMYRNPPYTTVDLPPPPPTEPMEGRSEAGFNDYYMSQPRVPHPQYPSRTLPGFNFQTQSDLVPPEGQPDVKWECRTCALCLERFEGTNPKSRFPYRCKRCASGDYCAECLKDWFIEACKNESRMPPKCSCSAIPLSSVSNLLNNAEIELYKAKYEEWATPNRLYCPVPTCSTFIPQRIYVKIQQGPGASSNDPRGADTLPVGSMLTIKNDHPKKDIRPHAACPTCGVSICTKCKSLSHIGECSETDLDPVLEEQLKKWKIKRCPKCRAGVRRMYGCSHIECRCGAHFCWECMLPINQCGGQCDDEASDADADSQVAEDDLDGNAGYFEGGGPDFGPEPYGHIIDAWGCQHLWTLVFPASPSALARRHLECNRCFRIVQPSAKDPLPKPPLDNEIEMTGMYPHSQTDFQGKSLWQCFSGHICCTRCPKEPPASRNGDPSRLWACDCGIHCLTCDKQEAMGKYANDQKLAQEQKEKADSVAWECRCGTILCTTCKASSEAA